MAENENKKKVEIDADLLASIQKDMAESKRKIAELEAAALVADVQAGKKDIRELESLEEKFKTKKYYLRKVKLVDDKGNDKGGIVVGWTDRGAYEVVDKSGVSAIMVNYMDVYFLGKKEPVTIKAMALKDGERIECTEISRDIKIHKHKTGEEIEVMEWDEKHGHLSTGTMIDGYYATPEGTITIQIPGEAEPYTINQKYLNA